MPQQYFCLLTKVGEAKDANAKALGTALKITHMAVGDGNGALPVPDRNRTALVREVRRAPLNSLTRDPVNQNQVIAEQVLPEDVGGWWIREIGLYDVDGDLIAIGNCAESYKPQLAQGSGRTQVVRMVLIMTSAATVELKIDPSIVLATRKYVDDQDAEHEAAEDPHPQYTTTAELATAIAPKAPLASPALTGNPTAPTPTVGDNDTSIATTAFVQTAVKGVLGKSVAGGANVTLAATEHAYPVIRLTGALTASISVIVPNSGQWVIANATTGAFTVTIKTATGTGIVVAQGRATHLFADGTNVVDAISDFADVALTGNPTAPTPAAGDNDTSIATTAFVQAAIAALVNSSPAALDTLNELAAALGNDANFATTMTTALAAKAPLASPALTGNPTAPTAAVGDNDTSIATTAFVQAATNGMLTKSVAGGAQVTLTAAEAGYAIIKLTGALTAHINVVVPATAARWTIWNATTGAYNVTIKTSAGTGIVVTQGTTWQLMCDGINVLDASSDFKDISLTGNPTAPTPAAGDNDTSIATTAFVQAAIAALVNSSPAALDTLNELAAALGNDANFATTMTTALAAKAPLASPALTGNPTAPTPAAGDNDTSIATTAFVQTATNGMLTKSVAGGANVTLTAAEASYPVIKLTGALTASISVIVPNATNRVIVWNATTGAFTVTVKTSAGTGVLVAQGKTSNLFCDAANVIDANSDTTDMALTGNPTAPTPAAGDNDTSIATTAFVQAAIAALVNSPMFAATKAASGYQKLPSGLIIQWGTFTQNDNGTALPFTVNYPIAFPTGGLQAFLTPGNAVPATGGATVESIGAGSMTGFTSANTATRTWRYLVIGY